MVKVIIINGTGGSGKDTFVNFCMEHTVDKDGYMIYNVSSVDKVKEAAVILGWDGGKTEKDRKFLSDLKILVEGYNDGNFKYMVDMFNEVNNVTTEDNKAIIFFHVREPKEIERLVKTFGKENCITLLVKSNRVEDIKSNMADAGVYDYEYNMILHNDYSLERLRMEAKCFVDVLLEDEKGE